MKRKKSIVIVISLAICLILVIFVQITSYDRDESKLIKVGLLPTYSKDETYLFTLRDSGVLEVTYGDRKHDNIRKKNFMKKVTKSDQRKLTEAEFQNLIELANIVDTSDEKVEKRYYLGGWQTTVSIYYKNKIYNFDLEDGLDGFYEDISKLFNSMLDSSPMPVEIDGENWTNISRWHERYRNLKSKDTKTRENVCNH